MLPIQISTLFLSLAFCLEALAEYCPTKPIGAPPQSTLTGVATATLDVTSGLPYGITFAKQGDTAFVALSSGNQSFLGVLDTSNLEPRLMHRIPFPSGFQVEGAFVSPNGQNVYGAGEEGAIIFDAAKAAAGDNDSVVGMLNGYNGTSELGASSVAVALTSDDKYAFVSDEYGPTPEGITTTGNIQAFELDTTSNGTITGRFLTYISLGYAVVGATLSPDGKYLYAISELSTLSLTSTGLLSMIEVSSLMGRSGAANVSNVFAGCQPTRSIVSCDGRTVWVSARYSNSILAFDTAKILAGSTDALIATVPVGTEPNDLVFARNETRIVVVNSNRSPNRPMNATTGLSVVDVQAALSGRPALLGAVPAGNATSFPREVAISADGKTLLVSLFEASQILAVNVSTLP